MWDGDTNGVQSSVDDVEDRAHEQKVAMTAELVHNFGDVQVLPVPECRAVSESLSRRSLVVHGISLMNKMKPRVSLCSKTQGFMGARFDSAQ